MIREQGLVKSTSEPASEKLDEAQKQQLVKILTCSLCNGLFRFAHTLTQCGHTFCYVCITNHIKNVKARNILVKCPHCHLPIDLNYKKSIMKDIYKQSLVDTLFPQFSQRQSLIIQRIRTLFPDIDLQFILQQFKFCATDQKNINKPKHQQQVNLALKLQEKIKNNLDISFETFCENILNDESYDEYLKKSKKPNENADSKIIELRPKSQRDFNYVGLKNQMKISNITTVKLRRYLQRKVLDQAKKTGSFAQSWINSQSDKLQIKVALQINGKLINDQEDLQILMNNQKNPITYSVN